jgi:hypothetical protein
MIELKEGENRELINHEDEIKAISQYIKENWSGWENIRNKTTEKPAIDEFVSFVYYQGINDSKAWFDEHEVTFETIHEMEEARKDFLQKTPFKDVYILDSFHKTLSGLYYGFTDIKRAFTDYKFWDFSQQVEKTLNNANKFFSNLEYESLMPINWQEEYPNMNSRNDFKIYIFEQFEGHNSSGLRSFNLPENLYFSNVQYNDEEQGRSKITTLTSAIYSQALGISENNNTFNIKKVLQEFDNEFKNTPINGEKIDTSILKKHPVVELALVVFNSKNIKYGEQKEYSHDDLVQMVNESKAKKEEWDNKTEEEKEDIKKQRTKDAMEMIDKMMNKMDNEEKDNYQFIRNAFKEITEEKTLSKKNRPRF